VPLQLYKRYRKYQYRCKEDANKAFDIVEHRQDHPYQVTRLLKQSESGKASADHNAEIGYQVDDVYCIVACVMFDLRATSFCMCFFGQPIVNNMCHAIYDN